MFDLKVNVSSFEDFLVEDSKAMSDANHDNKNGDQGMHKVDGTLPGGSMTPDVIEKSDMAANGDKTGDKLAEGPDKGSESADVIEKSDRAANGDKSGSTIKAP